MLYKNHTAAIIVIDSLKGRVWSLDQETIGPNTVVDIPDEMLSDREIKSAIRSGTLIPVSEKPRIKVPWCPKNGTHGVINGAAPESEIAPCKRCGRGGLTTHTQYCPSCFTCLRCDRIIKRKFNQ